MNLTRREALSKGSLAVGGAIALAGCAATTVNGVTTYGLDPTVVTFIQDAVSAVAKYVRKASITRWQWRLRNLLSLELSSATRSRAFLFSHNKETRTCL